MKPFPVSSFDSSSGSQRIHFHPSRKTISDPSQTQPDPSPPPPTLKSFISLRMISLCVWEREREGKVEVGYEVQSGVQYEFPSGMTGNQWGSAAVCAPKLDAPGVLSPHRWPSGLWRRTHTHTHTYSTCTGWQTHTAAVLYAYCMCWANTNTQGHGSNTRTALPVYRTTPCCCLSYTNTHMVGSGLLQGGIDLRIHLPETLPLLYFCTMAEEEWNKNRSGCSYNMKHTFN